MIILPLHLKEANEFVENFHRHSRPVVGHKFSLGASDGDSLIGVAIVGRPIARNLDDGFTAEVTRCCVVPEAQKGACSFLYSHCWRVWRAMGGTSIITYTLQRESGSSLKGAGWRIVNQVPGAVPGKGWQNRQGRDWQPVFGQQKFRWQAA